MSAEELTIDLDELYHAIEAGRVSERAVPFFDKYDEIARSILDTVETMVTKGVDPPTHAQARALRNIYLGACYWLGRTPEPSAIGPDPARGGLRIDYLPS